jgi:GMP synthase (glutamine-hydrolysing)
MGSTAAAALPASAGSGQNLVLILDFGSQYTHLITRRVRQLGVLSLCVSGTAPLASLEGLRPRAVILSGGPHSVHALGAPSFPEGFLDFAANAGAHVLGVCYGMQLLVQSLGGAVQPGERQEYGKMDIEVTAGSSMLYGGEGEVGKRQTVWMSHGDEAVRLPEGFEVVARSLQGAVAAIENREKHFYGLQYHPEVATVTGCGQFLFSLFLMGPHFFQFVVKMELMCIAYTSLFGLYMFNCWWSFSYPL